jgi:hypothetical protein
MGEKQIYPWFFFKLSFMTGRPFLFFIFVIYAAVVTHLAGEVQRVMRPTTPHATVQPPQMRRKNLPFLPNCSASGVTKLCIAPM